MYSMLSSTDTKVALASSYRNKIKLWYFQWIKLALSTETHCQFESDSFSTKPSGNNSGSLKELSRHCSTQEPPGTSHNPLLLPEVIMPQVTLNPSSNWLFAVVTNGGFTELLISHFFSYVGPHQHTDVYFQLLSNEVRDELQATRTLINPLKRR